MVKKTNGFIFILFSLLAFTGLGIEMLYALLLEPLIYGASMQEWALYQHISHWIITCITWGIIAVLLVIYSRKKFGFDIFEKKDSMKIWQWAVEIACFAFMFIVSYMDWNGFKIIKEFQYNGLTKFIFQYIYYFFETILVLLIIVFGQKAGEHWFKNRFIPYGGVTAALTWGVVHMLTKGSLAAGLLSALSGVIFGVVYLLTNKSIIKTFPILFIMFII